MKEILEIEQEIIDKHRYKIVSARVKCTTSIFDESLAIQDFFNDAVGKEESATELTMKWLKCSSETVSRWKTIAKNIDKFKLIDNQLVNSLIKSTTYVSNLPNSMHSIYLLCGLDKESIQSCLRLKGSDTRQGDILAYKANLDYAAKQSDPEYKEKQKEYKKEHEANEKAYQEKTSKKEEEKKTQKEKEKKEFEENMEKARREAEENMKRFYERTKEELKPFNSNNPKQYLKDICGLIIESGEKDQLKLLKSFLMRCYHPDNAKIKADTEITSNLNKAFTKLGVK